jgi:CheY-like chemotaxis protein
MTAELLEVVLIDDEPSIVNVLSRVLATRSRLRLCGFTESAAALQWMEGHVPALVITDHIMPGPNGLDVARRLRGQPSTHDVPILMLTGAIDADLQAEARSAGITRLAHKPLRMGELLGYIDDLLSGLPQFL